MTVSAVWFEIYVNDIERAKDFYEKLFDVQLKRLSHSNMAADMEYWAFPDASPSSYGASGALVKMPGCESSRSSTIVYFASNDCGSMAAKAVGLGGRLRLDKMAIGDYGSISLVYDTEGNLIGLHSM